MHRLTRHLTRRGVAVPLLLVLVASACSTAPKKTEVYFPPPPDKARFEWIRSFRHEDDMGQSVWRKIWKALVPHDVTNGLYSPTGLALSPDEGTLYAALPHRGRVVSVNLQTGVFSAIGTGGRAPLTRPIGVATDSSGNIYVTDKAASAVYVYRPDGSLLSRFGKENLSGPSSLAIDRRSQLLYVINDASNNEGRHSVEVFSLAGKHLRTIGGGRSGDPGYFNFPRGLAVSRAGEVFVGDMLNFRVQVFDAEGRLVRMFGDAGVGHPGLFDKIHGIAFDSLDNIYVTDAMQGVHVVNDDAYPLMLFGPPVMRAASAIVISSKNRIFVADILHAVHEFQLVNTTPDDARPKRSPKAAPAQRTGAPTPAPTPTVAPAPIDAEPR